MSVYCVCCVFSGKRTLRRAITRPGESIEYGVFECGLETSTMRKPTRAVEP